jgi:GH24 family phage-related lysozyme (muramidase)
VETTAEAGLERSVDFDEMLARAASDEILAEGAGAARAADLEELDGASTETAQPGGAPGTRMISPDAVALIIAFEVTSRAAYERLYRAPIWPGGASGVTIGIGYDLGYVGAERFENDWGTRLGAETIQRFSEACGATGEVARALTAGLHDLRVEWEDAEHVFRTRTLPLYTGTVERTLPNIELLNADSLGALVSLVYNRGASFRREGDRFAEMRAILSLMARRTPWNIPAQIRAMRRIWAGQPNMAGLLRRREAEASLFERGLETPVAGGAVPEAASIRAEGALGDAVRVVGGWISRVVEAPTRDMVFAPIVAPAGWLAGGQEIEPGEAYVALRVLSARVVHARRLFSRYHAAVHARLDMLYEGGTGRSEREVVLAPDDFRNLDPGGGGRLLQLDRPLFGPAPYIGDLRLSLGLFSVKSSDLAGPYLALLSQLAETSALGFLRAAQPFVAPLRGAVELLFGTSGNADLDCGVVRGFSALRTGLWASIGATRAEIDPAGLQLDPLDFRLLHADGLAVTEYPYVVFSIESAGARADWMAVPDLREAWEALRGRVADGAPETELHALFDAFRRRCLASPDLTSADARRLVRRAEARFAGTGPATEAAAPRLGRFSDLDLYGARG